LANFDQVLVPEMNGGQLALLLRAGFLKDVTSYPKVEGKPFYRHEILTKIKQCLEVADAN
jgi:2-oxoglutarate ferredoxin oxidoreductase subunit alpha